MRIAPESRRKALDASEAVGSQYAASGDFEAISDAPTASDAETIADLRRLLAERDAECKLLREQLDACAWWEVDLTDPGAPAKPIPISRGFPWSWS